jgi:hypothetical protein
MIAGVLARFGFFFRPFRKGAYRHAPSIEELHQRRQRHMGRLSKVIRVSGRFARHLLPSARQ